MTASSSIKAKTSTTVRVSACPITGILIGGVSYYAKTPVNDEG
jgi:hypothetical protein